MPRQKNFKQLVRQRMAKTGESYTTARSRFVLPPTDLSTVDGDPDAGALARALAAASVGLPLTEPLLFGLGGGIGFSYLVFVYPGWTSINLDGRYNALYFDKKSVIENACARLGIPVRVQQLPNPDLADRRLRQALKAAPEVAITVALPGHMPSPYPVTVSENGDNLTVTGLPGGPATMEWSELIATRWTQAKKYGGLFTIGQPPGDTDLKSAILSAIDRTAGCLLEPSRSTYDGNFGIPGMGKWARLLTDPRDPKGWPTLCPDQESLRAALTSVVRGLGTAASRRLYATFLDEAAALLNNPALTAVADTYRDLGRRWAELIRLADRPGTTAPDLAKLLPDLAAAEQSAATSLRAGAQ